jgi:hypothetical protein
LEVEKVEEEKEGISEENKKLSDRKRYKLNKYAEKYKTHERLLIASSTRKTIRYVERNVSNFPNKYSVLKNKIIQSCYSILENIYRANIFQDKNDKKEIIVHINMLNFYLEEALRKKLISPKKFESYVKHLIEIDKMTRSWLNYEVNK